MESKVKRVRATLGQVRSLESELASCKASLSVLEGKVALLERSNLLLENELRLVRKVNTVYSDINEYLYARVKRYECMGFFKRLFGYA